MQRALHQAQAMGVESQGQSQLQQHVSLTPRVLRPQQYGSGQHEAQAVAAAGKAYPSSTVAGVPAPEEPPVTAIAAAAGGSTSSAAAALPPAQIAPALAAAAAAALNAPPTAPTAAGGARSSAANGRQASPPTSALSSAAAAAAAAGGGKTSSNAARLQGAHEACAVATAAAGDTLAPAQSWSDSRRARSKRTRGDGDSQTEYVLIPPRAKRRSRDLLTDHQREVFQRQRQGKPRLS